MKITTANIPILDEISREFTHVEYCTANTLTMQIHQIQRQSTIAQVSHHTIFQMQMAKLFIARIQIVQSYEKTCWPNAQ